MAVLESAAIALGNDRLPERLHHLSQLNAHKLAGSLGSFGISEGSKLARTLETQLRARTIFASDARASQDTKAQDTKAHHQISDEIEADTAEGAQAVTLLAPSAFMGLVKQLRYCIEQATVQTISQSLSTMVRGSTPLLLIVSSDWRAGGAA